MCILFCSSVVCISAYAYIFKYKFHCGSAFDLRTTSLLCTTCMRSCCNWSASCVSAVQPKNQKTKARGPSS